MSDQLLIAELKAAIERHLHDVGTVRAAEILVSLADELPQVKVYDCQFYWPEGVNELALYDFECPGCCHIFTLDDEQHDEAAGVIQCPECGNMFDEE